jgi:hypothetical protein
MLLSLLVALRKFLGLVGSNVDIIELQVLFIAEQASTHRTVPYLLLNLL